MKFVFFAVPALAPDAAQGDLNRFLSAHRVLAVDRHLVGCGTDAFWAICVSYTTAGASPPAKKGKIDYKEILSAQDFAVFAKLRSLRKELAEKDGVPAYALFTNEQLAAMVTKGIRTTTELGSLAGVGPARIEKYGPAFLNLLREQDSGDPGQSGARDG